jgi:hypothetical protein
MGDDADDDGVDLDFEERDLADLGVVEATPTENVRDAGGMNAPAGADDVDEEGVGNVDGRDAVVENEIDDGMNGVSK